MWTTNGDTGNEPDDQRVAQAVARLSDSAHTGALATSSGDGPTVCTVYLARDENRYWFTSQTTTQHAADIRAHGRVGLSIWIAPTNWGDPLQGLQLRGNAIEVTAADDAVTGLDSLHARFPGTVNTLPGVESVTGETRTTCLFVVTCESGSIRDEAVFGKGKFPILWTGA